jgi:hypothetical protein
MTYEAGPDKATASGNPLGGDLSWTEIEPAQAHAPQDRTGGPKYQSLVEIEGMTNACAFEDRVNSPVCHLERRKD